MGDVEVTLKLKKNQKAIIIDTSRKKIKIEKYGRLNIMKQRELLLRNDLTSSDKALIFTLQAYASFYDGCIREVTGRGFEKPMSLNKIYELSGLTKPTGIKVIKHLQELNIVRIAPVCKVNTQILVNEDKEDVTAYELTENIESNKGIFLNPDYFCSGIFIYSYVMDYFKMSQEDLEKMLDK